MVREDLYANLRRKALGWTLVLIGAGAWIGLLLANLVSHRSPTEWIGAAVAIVSLCGALYFLRENYLRLTCYIAVACMWTGSAILAFHAPPPALYLFGLVIMLSSSLIQFPATIILTAASTVLLLHAGGEALAIGPLINVWGSLIAGVVVSRGLYQALESINRHHDYTTEQMNLARDHRAQLVKLTKALKEATEELQHANIQLRYARGAAEEARQLKARFAANVSHELRTPINLVIGYSEVMVTAPEIYGAPLPPAYRSDIHAIYRNAKHLQDLINDVLDISQIEASRLAVTREKTNVRETLYEAANMARDLISAKGVQFLLEIPDDLTELWIDRTRIRQVVLNLLANAARFTDQGAITLRALQDKGEVVVSVIDTGIGIAQGDLSQVFEEFYQIEATPSHKQGGTGLGLTLSMHVIQHHGGRLWAESDGIAGHGSTFSFTLPIFADSRLLEGNPISTSVVRHNPKCVILFDDDVAVGQLFKRYLNKHEVVISHSREDVLRLTQVIQPSAVVLSRDRRSADFEKQLAKCNADTAMIFCPMPSGRHAAEERGVADYLVKPITRQALINAIVALEKPVNKILVVDDERDVARMLGRMLQTYDQRVVVLQANNGEDGLALMHREQPDVVLLDIQMPVMDGFSVIHRMKQDPLLQHIPVIIASARGPEEEIAAAVDGEMTVVRPTKFTPVELVNCVEAVVNVLTPSTAPVTQGS
jgi:signal transduction histidine kinase/CheY-like chemotaxis protein